MDMWLQLLSLIYYFCVAAVATCPSEQLSAIADIIFFFLHVNDIKRTHIY